jgi:hypothetical protein
VSLVACGVAAAGLCARITPPEKPIAPIIITAIETRDSMFMSGFSASEAEP